MDCPHCGRTVVLDLKQAELKKTASVGAPAPKRLDTGIVESLTKSVEAKLVRDPIAALARFAEQPKLSSDIKKDFITGWGDSARQLMKKRDDLMREGYVPPEKTKDVMEKGSGGQKASALQSMIMRSLGGSRA